MTLLSSVLIIDDDPVHNFLCHSILKRYGLCKLIQFAKNGAEGLERIQERIDHSVPPHELVLLDLFMPVMDGYQFLKEFEKLTFRSKDDISIIVTSVAPREKVLSNLPGKTKYPFISKPLTAEKLLSALTEGKVNSTANGKL